MWQKLRKKKKRFAEFQARHKEINDRLRQSSRTVVMTQPLIVFVSDGIGTKSDTPANCGVFKHEGILAYAKEVRETRDIAELVALLNSGDWIATLAVPSKPPLFVLMRV